MSRELGIEVADGAADLDIAVDDRFAGGRWLCNVRNDFALRFDIRCVNVDAVESVRAESRRVRLPIGCWLGRLLR
ncbi:hypothetical protein B2J88_50805 [Rhodococcus sp. SRB_17]|nr:hypothetical protein [Rhodococcus sp. SRB_17]